MKISLSTKNRFIKKDIEIDLSQGQLCTLNRDNGKVTQFIMQKALRQGSSVVTYGGFADFYQYIHTYAPNQIATITYNDLIENATVPYIANTDKAAALKVCESFEDYNLSSRYLYMSDRKGQQYADPSMYQCFYQIKAGDITKRKAVTESFLVNVIANALYGRPIHEVLMLIEMPFRPVTDTMLQMLNYAKEINNFNIICTYRSDVYDGQEYALYLKDEKLMLKSRKKEFEVAYEEI